VYKVKAGCYFTPVEGYALDRVTIPHPPKLGDNTLRRRIVVEDEECEHAYCKRKRTGTSTEVSSTCEESQTPFTSETEEVREAVEPQNEISTGPEPALPQPFFLKPMQIKPPPERLHFLKMQRAYRFPDTSERTKPVVKARPSLGHILTDFIRGPNWQPKFRPVQPVTVPEAPLAKTYKPRTVRLYSRITSEPKPVDKFELVIDREFVRNYLERAIRDRKRSVACGADDGSDSVAQPGQEKRLRVSLEEGFEGLPEWTPLVTPKFGCSTDSEDSDGNSLERAIRDRKRTVSCDAEDGSDSRAQPGQEKRQRSVSFGAEDGSDYIAQLGQENCQRSVSFGAEDGSDSIAQLGQEKRLRVSLEEGFEGFPEWIPLETPKLGTDSADSDGEDSPVEGVPCTDPAGEENAEVTTPVTPLSRPPPASCSDTEKSPNDREKRARESPPPTESNPEVLELRGGKRIRLEPGGPDEITSRLCGDTYTNLSASGFSGAAGRERSSPG